MNDPQMSEFNPITREQVMQCVVKADAVPWNALRYAICTDLAFADGSKMVNKDETVFVVHGYPRDGSGDVYVVEGHGSNTWREEDFSRRLVSTVQRYRRQGRRVTFITGEKARAGLKDAYRNLLRNHFSDANEPMPAYHEFERGSGKKENRLATAASFWVDGHVKIVEGCPGFDKLTEQMTKIGQYMINNRTKIDWADAHSDAFSYPLYQPMRRAGNTNEPWEKGSTPIATDGLDRRQFDEQWYGDGRPPLR
jgi:hypothetical protein